MKNWEESNTRMNRASSPMVSYEVDGRDEPPTARRNGSAFLNDKLMQLGESKSGRERSTRPIGEIVGGVTVSHGGSVQTMDSILAKLDCCMRMVEKLTRHSIGDDFHKNHSPESSKSQYQFADEYVGSHTEVRDQLSFLDGGFNRLCASSTEAESGTYAMDENHNAMSTEANLTSHKNHSRVRDYHKNCSEYQVRSTNWERNRSKISLGYRSGVLPVVNRDSLIKKIEMPTFDDKHIQEWLSDAEHFFTVCGFREEDKLEVVSLSVQGRVKKWFAWVLKRGGFCDWLDFKQKLLIRFSESIDDEGALVEVLHPIIDDLKSDMAAVKLRHIACPAIDQGESCSPSELMSQKESVVSGFEDFVQQEVSSNEEELGNAIPCRSSDTLELIKATLEQELQITAVSHLETTCVLQPQQPDHSILEEKNLLVHGIMGEMDDAANVEQSQLFTDLLQSCSVHRGANAVFPSPVYATITQNLSESTLDQKQKCCKSWKFKYKSEQGLVALGSERKPLTSKYVESQLEKSQRFKKAESFYATDPSDCRVISSRQDELKCRLLNLVGSRKHSLIVRRLLVFKDTCRIQGEWYCFANDSTKADSQVWHRWKNKLEVLHKVLTLVVLKLIFFHLQRIHVFSSLVCDYREDLELCFATVERQNIQNRRQLIPKTKCELITWIQGRDLLWEHLRENAAIHVRQVVLVPMELHDTLYIQCLIGSSWEKRCYKNYIFKDNHRDGPVLKGVLLKNKDSFFQHLAKKLQTSILAQLLLRTLLPHFLELKEVIWQLFCFGVQPQRSLQRTYPLILLSISLRASLFSRRGVYKRILDGWLIVNVLIGLFSSATESDIIDQSVRKQEKKTEARIHWVVHMVNQQRGSLLMHIKRCLRQVLVQQKRRLKKGYKSMMFKYKQRWICSVVPSTVMFSTRYCAASIVLQCQGIIFKL